MFDLYEMELKPDELILNLNAGEKIKMQQHPSHNSHYTINVILYIVS